MANGRQWLYCSFLFTLTVWHVAFSSMSGFASKHCPRCELRARCPLLCPAVIPAGLADSESHVSSLHEQLAQRRTRKQLLKNAMIAPGRVALRGGKAALHGVAYGVGGPTAWVLTKSRAGVGATGLWPSE